MNENHAKFSGVFIPREVLLDQELPANAKIIFAIIQSLDNDKGCFASNQYIGEMLGLSESSVRSSITELERKQYVTRVVGPDNSRTIRTCTTASLVRADTRQISSTPPPENKRPPRQKTGGYSNSNRNSDIKWISLPPLPHGEELASAWKDWQAYREERKNPLTPKTITAQIQFLTTLSEPDAITSIRNSIQNGWSGLFAPRAFNKQSHSKPLTQSDHEAF
jgi:hypothetical protein